jgi:predicted lipoprotein with Yx(FWY)xxD motif
LRPMRRTAIAGSHFGAVIGLLAAVGARAAAAPVTEAYVHVPIPPHFRVEATELDGPVFADERGRTLYTWPFKVMRVGNTGDPKGQSHCTSTKTTVSSGYMSPYPGGLELPELDSRASCAQKWPPVMAAAGAKPVGKWTIITREDGGRQWAYDGLPVYTSVLDRRPGDVLGGESYAHEGDQPAVRHPIGPPADVPPGFQVSSTVVGRLLQTERGFSVYASDTDAPGQSNCDATCAKTWLPMVAPESVRPHGDWTIIERAPGVRQWAFRGKPLYRYSLDSFARSLEGSDVPGWHNVYTQRAPSPPAEFTVQDTSAGQVLADPHGMTIYSYACGDDAVDQLGCDHPSDTQVYRLAMCGGGDWARCLHTFPYVIAPKGATSHSRSWSIIDIDPKTGRVATAAQGDALHVWAYRDRPVYVYAGDRQPGEVNGDGHGEFRGEREGYNAFWLRDDYFGRGG